MHSEDPRRTPRSTMLITTNYLHSSPAPVWFYFFMIDCVLSTRAIAWRKIQIILSHCVTESGVRPLTVQKPIKRQGWWKGKFALFQMPATRGRGGLLSKGRLPPTDSQWARAFIDGRRGLHSETAQSALTVILTLVIRGLPSIILIVLSAVSLHFQGRFVPISLRQILGIAGACVMATV